MLPNLGQRLVDALFAFLNWPCSALDRVAGGRPAAHDPEGLCIVDRVEWQSSEEAHIRDKILLVLGWFFGT